MPGCSSASSTSPRVVTTRDSPGSASPVAPTCSTSTATRTTTARCSRSLGEEAPRRLAECAIGLIELGSHDGVHPRIGVVDVVPFVALDGSTPADAVVARDRFCGWAADVLDLAVLPLRAGAHPAGGSTWRVRDHRARLRSASHDTRRRAPAQSGRARCSSPTTCGFRRPTSPRCDGLPRRFAVLRFAPWGSRWATGSRSRAT